MAGSQFHNVSDVATAMKEFGRQTSQAQSRGSFATQDMLTTFSDALNCLCSEVMQLRAELDDLRTQKRSSDGAVPKPKGRMKKAKPTKGAVKSRR